MIGDRAQPGNEVVVMSATRSAAPRSRRAGHATAYSIDDLLADPAVDAVYISTNRLRGAGVAAAVAGARVVRSRWR
jgi:predicted dehydrogenase